MVNKKRRKDILDILKQQANPVTGTQLSNEFAVTRQVIVADIALLRAQGEEIIATPQGYLYTDPPASKLVSYTLASKHTSDPEQIREELYTIVDQGGRVRDVTVEHPIYGEITASLHIASRYDADQFLSKLQQANAAPLLVLTDGLHLHTIETPSEEIYTRICNALAKQGFVVELSE